MTDFDVVDALASFAEDLKSEAAFAERLHAAVAKMKAAHETERAALLDEIARLRALLDEAESIVRDYSPGHTVWLDAVAAERKP